MSNLVDGIGGIVAVLIFLGVAFEVYRYIKGHPQALAALEAKVKGIEGQAKATITTDAALIHQKLDSLAEKLGMIHTAVQMPLQIVTSAPVAGPMVAPALAAPVPVRITYADWVDEFGPINGAPAWVVTQWGVEHSGSGGAATGTVSLAAPAPVAQASTSTQVAAAQAPADNALQTNGPPNQKQMTANAPLIFTFNIPDGSKSQQFLFMGVAGSYFHTMTTMIMQGSQVIRPLTSSTHAGSQPYDSYTAAYPAGDYTIQVAFDVTGMFGVQYRA